MPCGNTIRMAREADMYELCFFIDEKLVGNYRCYHENLLYL